MLGFLAVACIFTALASHATASAADASRRPNIVIILGDDLGFADMGSFGSEIKTPNLDSLAKDGVRFTNFYTHASCSPTRSMLLSGVDTHLNGLGNMNEWIAPNQRGRGRLRGLPQQPCGHAAAAAQGRRLPHLHGRQVAHGQGARPDPGGARLRARLLAARRRRQLLGHDELHRRRRRSRSSPRTAAT
ncbi:MAG: sulfatase-like hydrolase/transferase [Desulfobacterales bacterium]|nr:sulfatase-like hydrolase/transferase [Desulfobacterales bacterium]